MTKDQYIKEKAKYLGHRLLDMITEVKPRTRQKKLDALEVGHLERRLEDYFKGYTLEAFDPLLVEIIEAFERQKDKASKSSVQLKYFTLETMLRPRNFKRIIQWNLEELDEIKDKKSKESDKWSIYKTYNVKFSEEGL
ncbi:MAG: hypothetical protein AAF620_00165 [Bacteroidota bacterium]